MTKARDEGDVVASSAVRYTLCGVQGCCPTVEVNHATGQVIIRDDCGGTAVLTKDEWHDAQTKVKL